LKKGKKAIAGEFSTTRTIAKAKSEEGEKVKKKKGRGSGQRLRSHELLK